MHDRLQWDGDKQSSLCVLGSAQRGHRREQFGETLAGLATASQATKWLALYDGNALEGLPSTFCEVTGTLSPWSN